MTQFGTREEYHNLLKTGGYMTCPFCDEASQKDMTLWSGKYWNIVYNKYPYTGNDQHIMAIPRRHIVYFCDLLPEELVELGSVSAWIAGYFGGNNYFSFTRETMSGRSIEHLHIHYVAGTIKGKFLRKMLEIQGFPIQQDLSL